MTGWVAIRDRVCDPEGHTGVVTALLEGDRLAVKLDSGLTMSYRPGDLTAHDDWPVHEPEAYDAPIPGRHWYSGCEPGGDLDPETMQYAGTGPRVNPVTGVCEGCGKHACPECGRENCPDHGKETT